MTAAAAPSEKRDLDVEFAKKLASNDVTVRDRALRTLPSWLGKQVAKGDFGETELLKLWKVGHFLESFSLVPGTRRLFFLFCA
jgi:hypothetical protein